jgi:chloramphenicol-sensitive protein RarD
MTVAAVLLGTDWTIYIYAVQRSRVVEAALGVFICPLLSVLFGLIIFRERLTRTQWVGIGIIIAAIALLTFTYGQFPWIALGIAVPFALYGLVKKHLGVPAVDGIFFESSVLTVPAFVYLGWLTWSGHSTFHPISGGWHSLQLISSGPVTIIPLMLFSAAANRIPMTVLGVGQYLCTSLQWLTGVFIFREAMPAMRLVGFGMVWLALIIVTAEAGWRSRRPSGARPASPPVLPVAQPHTARAATKLMVIPMRSTCDRPTPRCHPGQPTQCGQSELV